MKIRSIPPSEDFELLANDDRSLLIGSEDECKKEADRLETEGFDDSIEVSEATIAELQQLAKTHEVNPFSQLAATWFASIIGKRANRNADCDLAAVVLALTTQDFNLFQIAYAGVLEDIELHPESEDAKPVSEADRAEIENAMKRLGFIHD